MKQIKENGGVANVAKRAIGYINICGKVIFVLQALSGVFCVISTAKFCLECSP